MVRILFEYVNVTGTGHFKKIDCVNLTGMGYFSKMWCVNVYGLLSKKSDCVIVTDTGYFQKIELRKRYVLQWIKNNLRHRIPSSFTHFWVWGEPGNT